MIEIKSLSRNFGEIRAVDDISFTVDKGMITGFLGPNGAGKTTTLRMMVGYLQPSSGSILLDGMSIFEQPMVASAKIGYLPEHNPLYEEMYVVEALKYMADLRKMSKAGFTARKAYVVAKCGLQDVQYQKISTLSKGFRQRVGLAQAILHDPEILILDEPTSGLDPNQIIEIRELIRSLGKEKTVILSSHILQEVQATCDRVLIINKGKIIVDDGIAQLDNYLAEYYLLHLELEGENIDLSEFVDYYPEVSVIEEEHEGDIYKLKLKVSAGIEVKHDLARFIAENGWVILSLYTERKSLEEIFHKLTKEAGSIELAAYAQTLPAAEQEPMEEPELLPLEDNAEGIEADSEAREEEAR